MLWYKSIAMLWTNCWSFWWKSVLQTVRKPNHYMILFCILVSWKNFKQKQCKQFQKCFISSIKTLISKLNYSRGKAAVVWFKKKQLKLNSVEKVLFKYKKISNWFRHIYTISIPSLTAPWGYTKEPLFIPGAIHEIWTFSNYLLPQG